MARISKAAFEVVMQQLEHQATPLQISLLRNYVAVLEREIEVYARALEAAQSGQSKFWVEVRSDPEAV